MKKYLSLTIAVILTVFTFGHISRAEESTETAKPALYNNDLRQKVEAQREALKKELEAKREVLKTELQVKKGDFKAELEATKKVLEVKKEAFKAELQAKKKEFQAEIKTEREAFKTKLEVEKKEFKANIAEKRSEFRGKAKEILSGRFEAAVKNIISLQDRIAARIATLKTAGKDVSKAESYLADSKLKLTEAQAKLAEIKALIPTSDDKVTVENWEKIKDGANVVKNLIKEAHQDLVDAVKVLKGLSGVQMPETTPITSTVTQ